MKPLSRFFRSPPTPPTLATQVAVLDSAAPAELGATAVGDGPEALRIAAVRKLSDGEILRGLAGLREGNAPRPPSLERVAQERLAQLIDAAVIDLASLSAAPVNLSALLSVAGLCSDPAHLPMALARVVDPQQLARLVLEGSSIRIRQLAAQSLEDPAELRLLLKQVRGSDKSVYKIIKQKSDVLRAEERRIAQIESDVNSLCATLERHSHRIYDALYPPSLEQFEGRWRVLEMQAAPDVRERAARAIESCREVIARHHRQLAEQAAAALQKAALRTAREEALVQEAEQAQRHHDELAAAAAQAAQVREAEEKARAEKAAAEALALRQLGGLIGKANAALRDGVTGRAAGLRRAIEEKLTSLPALPGYLASQLQQLDVKLNELKEWKDYAVAPKRTELIEEMEALIGASYKPRVLADRIKQLQDDWKTISKGIISDSEADWQRFQQASLTAYQPCREYFETQAKQRQANLEKRKGVLARLQAFESAQAGEHPDWRTVAAVLREAPQELSRYFPVDRVASRSVQEEFDASILRLQARLDAWHAHNAEAKRALIQRAQHLRDSQDNRDAVDGVKRLQLEWKEVGAAERDMERRLWEEFRENCDAVFQKRQQVHAEYTAGLEASKARAVALCEEAEEVAARSGAALLEGVGRIAQWRAAFESLGDLPRADQRALHDRFERALQRCQAQVAQHKKREKERSFTQLLEAAAHIQAYGCAVAQEAAAEVREALKQSAEAFMAGVQQWPKGGAQALQEAWAKSEARADLDVAAQETALRMLCIRAEIVTDRPTPPEDHALRREYQVQRLVQRMVRNEAPDELDALALTWARVGPVPAVALAPLLERFLRCREHSPTR